MTACPGIRKIKLGLTAAVLLQLELSGSAFADSSPICVRIDDLLTAAKRPTSDTNFWREWFVIEHLDDGPNGFDAKQELRRLRARVAGMSHPIELSAKYFSIDPGDVLRGCTREREAYCTWSSFSFEGDQSTVQFNLNLRTPYETPAYGLDDVRRIDAIDISTSSSSYCGDWARIDADSKQSLDATAARWFGDKDKR